MSAPLPDFNHGEPRFEEAADVFPDLSVGLGRLPEVVPHLLVGFVHHPPLLHGHPPRCTSTGRTQHGFVPATRKKQRCSLKPRIMAINSLLTYSSTVFFGTESDLFELWHNAHLKLQIVLRKYTTFEANKIKSTMEKKKEHVQLFIDASHTSCLFSFFPP